MAESLQRDLSQQPAVSQKMTDFDTQGWNERGHAQLTRAHRNDLIEAKKTSDKNDGDRMKTNER